MKGSIGLAEGQLKALLEKQGWVIMRKGWPDFACVKDNRMIFVEVKGYHGERLKKQQHFILTNLAKQGLECYKWNPDSGFEKITPTMVELPEHRPGYQSTERAGRQFDRPHYNPADIA